MVYVNVSNLNGPKTQELAKKMAGVVYSGYYTMHPCIIEKGKGSLAYDVDGNTFIDLMAGVGIGVLGYDHPEVCEAITNQIQTLSHNNNHVVMSKAYIEYLEALQITMPEPLKNGRGFLANSGAEALEAAMKLARYYKKGRPYIIALDPCFHGRTTGPLAATTGAKGRKYMASVLSGVAHGKYPYQYRCPTDNATNYSLDSIRDILNRTVGADNVAAILIEPVAGEPGVIIPPEGYHKQLRELCNEYDILLVYDEVQMGFGKTGKWWCAEKFEAIPDIMTFAKPAGGGLPLGGIWAKEEIINQWEPGHHASTFGGAPVPCAAGKKTIEIIKRDNLLQRNLETQEYLTKKFNEMDYSIIGDRRVIGAIGGMEIIGENKTPDSKKALEIKKRAYEKGVLTSVCGANANVVRLSPAYNIERDVLDEALTLLNEAIKEVL